MIKNEYGIFKDIVNPETGEVLKSAEEVYKEYINHEQIDICNKKIPKTLEELTAENEQLWETVQFLLKKTGMIGDEENATD